MYCQLSEAQAWAIAIACAFMVMDILTGFIGAVINGNVSSAKMRVGLGHKILLCCIIIMEVASILENVCAAYPELRDTPLMRIFDHDGTGE